MNKLKWIAAAVSAVSTLGLATANAETFAEWLDRHGVPPAQQGPGDDPAGDGIGNTIKYALDLDPLASARDRLPAPEVENDRLTLEIPKNSEAVGIEIIVEASGDLENWSAEEVEVLNETDTVLEVADTELYSENARRYLRVRVPAIEVDEAPDAYLYVVGGRTRAVDEAKNWDNELDVVDLTASYADDPDIGPIDARSILIADVHVEDGTVTNWRRASNHLPDVHPDDDLGILQWNYMHDAVNYHNGRIYVGPAGFLGTANEQDDGSRRIYSDVVVSAEVDPVTGDIGEFTSSARLPSDPGNQRIMGTAITEVDGEYYFYVLGGSSDAGTTDMVSFGRIDSETGNVEEWDTTTLTLMTTDWFNAGIGFGGKVFHVAGNAAGDHAWQILGATPQQDDHSFGSKGDLFVDTWTPSDLWDGVRYDGDDEMDGAHWEQNVVVGEADGQNYIYIIGGAASNIGPVDRVDGATIEADGTLGEWTGMDPLPEVRRRSASAAFQDMIIMPGGSTTASYAAGQDTVFIGKIGSDGSVTWETSDEPMMQYRSYHGAAMAPAAQD